MNQFSAQKTLNYLLKRKQRLGITRIANLTHLDIFGIHVVTCTRPTGKHLSVAQGKGLSLEQAMISGLMETVEIYHFENPPESTVSGNYHTLKAHYSLLEPATLAPGIFDDIDHNAINLEWVSATNLIDHQPSLIPRTLVTLDSSRYQPHSHWFQVNTNGLASGPTLEHALHHSLCEIIERNALTTWQQSRDKDNKLIELNSITDNQINNIIHTAKQHNIIIKLWDITSEIGLPSFHCALLDARLGGLGISTGTGAHPEPLQALTRALTEAVQARLTLITGNRDDISRQHYEALKQLPNSFDTTPGKRQFQECHAFCDTDTPLANIIQQMIEQLKKDHAGIYLADLTCPEIQIPTTYVTIPGMQFEASKGGSQ